MSEIIAGYQNVERKSFFRDRCWASHISALGGVASIGAAVAMRKGHYEVAAGLTAVAGLADKFDGDEARRFAALHPDEGEKRAHRGAIEDKVWDKIRNTVLGTSIAIDKNYALPARVAAGAVAAREVVVGVGSFVVAGKLKKEGVPIEELDSMPSSPIGKETMWEFGIGEGLATSGVIAQKHGKPGLAKGMEYTAAGILAFGVYRGIESGIEYSAVFKEKLEAMRIGDTTWEPDYKPHIGTIVISAAHRFTRSTPEPAVIEPAA